MGTVMEMGAVVGVAVVCASLGIARASYYRGLKPKLPALRKASPRKLGDDERQAVLAILHEQRFADLAPAEVYATLLDEGRYLCSERTMYRVLAENSEVRERRDQLRHPSYAAPELLATRPINSGAGISPSSTGRPNGPIIISTSLSTYSVATRSAGWSRTARPPSWLSASSRALAAARKSSPDSSPSTPTAGPQ